MGMDMAAQDEGLSGDMGMGEEGGEMPPPNISDSLKHNLNKQKENLFEKLVGKTEETSKKIAGKLLNEKEDVKPRVEVFDKAFFVNEELDTMSRHLDAYMTERRNGE
jgi:hypothetical protein